MEEQPSCPSYDSDESTALSWADRVRPALTSDNVRWRLHMYSMLSTKCSESKEAQKHVGQLFGGPRPGVVSSVAPSSLLNILFDDLRSTDRTLRIAAARVVSLMVYENLTNQQRIIQSQMNGDEEQVGVTVGWVHIFTIPQSLRDRYQTQCEDRGLFTTPSGLVEFVSNVIKDNYASIYSRIGRYYAGGCRDFLPLCWFQSLVNESSEVTDILDVPDPSENLVGFYLVPRQMQFPEQDDYFLQEILASIRTDEELSRLQQVHAAFQQVAFRAKEATAAALKGALEKISHHMRPSLDDDKDALAVDQRHSNVFNWLNASSERMITWNELLTWCCADMNADEMLKRFGVDVCRAVDAIFRKLALEGQETQHQMGQTKSFVWESALVGALLGHPDLPAQFKANIRDLSTKYAGISRRKVEGNANPQRKTTARNATDKAVERPWEYLLPLELTEIHPISWSLFLSKWRQSADTKPDHEAQIYHQNERRHHSEGESTNPALLVARNNALVTLKHTNPRIFHSFRDLNQLRQQLPLIANRAPEVIDEMVEFPPSSSRLRSIKDDQLCEAEERELEKKRKMFRKLLHSSIELDEVTRTRLQEKREARFKAHEKAAENRKRAKQFAAQRQQEMERRKRDRQVKFQERIRRKEHYWQLLLGARQERHQRAQWWKQIQHEAEVARQEEFVQRQMEQHESTRRREQNQHAMIRRSSAEPIVSQPQPPSRERKTSCPRRPLSARTATDPQIIRERAHVYGCAATKAFTARKPQTARADLFSNTEQQYSSFRRQGRPATGIDESRQDESSASSATESKSRDPQASSTVANACETLVMINAAQAVAQHIVIPPVTGPSSEEETVPPAVIKAKYFALEKEQRVKLHERYCMNRVSHKLSYAVLQQLTHEMRQDAAWREFLKAAGGPSDSKSSTSKRHKSKRDAKVTYTAFAGVATQLGIAMPPKRLQAVARSLDPWKTGFVSWESFYTWWSAL